MTVLEANGDFDAGDVWATRTFPMRETGKGSIYRHEVRRGAIDALSRRSTRSSRAGRPSSRRGRRARARPCAPADDSRTCARSTGAPTPPRRCSARSARPRATRACSTRSPASASTCSAATASAACAALRASSSRSATGRSAGRPSTAPSGSPTSGDRRAGHPLQAAGDARARARRPPDRRRRRSPCPCTAARAEDTYREISYEEDAGVGYLHFDFYNGAMSTEQCRRLRDAYLTRVRAGRRT